MKTVLLVDDDREVLEVLRQALVYSGYAVLGTSQPHEALAISCNCPIDYAVLDCRLGEMHGAELAEDLRKQNPQLKILLISGYESGGIPSGQEFPLLQKPFSYKAFHSTLQQIP